MPQLGLEPGTVRVVPYDTAWPELYAAEIARLAPIVAGARVDLRFEHTGSTAVPGLAAKPVIDILAGLPGEAARGAAIAALERAGYAHRGEQSIPGRDFLRRGEPRQHHVHLTVAGSAVWNDLRDFRDWLRRHPDVAAEYAALKWALAAQHPADRKAYVEGKTAFVASVLRAARAHLDPEESPLLANALEIAPEALAGFAATALAASLDAELSARDPEAGAPHARLEPAEVAPGAGAFLVARWRGRPVGCGALRRLCGAAPAAALGPRVGELERMYVAPEVRGRGIGRALLDRLEAEARALGLTRLVLETGVGQTAALALYRRAGFTGIAPYGEYAASPATSVCLAKEL